MSKEFKPKGYNAVSPYFIVNGTQKMVDLLKQLFDAKELRKYSLPDGTILHMEMMLDDTVIMMGEASEKFPANKQLVHVYVKNVDEVYKKAMALGCTSIEAPKEQEGDPDRRCTFIDFSGNMWSVGMQL